MTRGRIQDLNRRTTAAERKAFEASVFSTPTGTTEIGVLRWGDEVDTGKSAADFVDWKFFEDYGLAGIRLDAVIASHCDADHYGGLWDLLRVDEEAGAELDCDEVEIGTFFHAGVSWWRPGNRWLGRKQDGFLIDLLDRADSVTAGLQPDADRRLQGEWAAFLGDVRRATSSIHRLGVSSGDGGEVFVLGFTAADGDARIRVLAPVLHAVDGHTGVRSLGSASQNTNGHSVLLRVDFRASRILLTGDLNRKSMRHLLDEYTGGEEVLACDVAKGCHHGSDDVSYTFLRHVNAAAIDLRIFARDAHYLPQEWEEDALSQKDTVSRIHYEQTKAGALRPSAGARSFRGCYLVSGLRYGLVNVRTDGETVLCATMNEAGRGWHVRTFPARF